jgi:hypothetical protein
MPQYSFVGQYQFIGQVSSNDCGDGQFNPGSYIPIPFEVDTDDGNGNLYGTIGKLGYQAQGQVDYTQWSMAGQQCDDTGCCASLEVDTAIEGPQAQFTFWYQCPYSQCSVSASGETYYQQ